MDHEWSLSWNFSQAFLDQKHFLVTLYKKHINLKKNFKQEGFMSGAGKIKAQTLVRARMELDQVEEANLNGIVSQARESDCWIAPYNVTWENTM